MLLPVPEGAPAAVGAGGGELRAGVVPMSRHPYGCRIIQRILEHCHLPDIKESVKAQAEDAALDLARDVYGNYISQHLVVHGSTEDRCARRPWRPPQSSKQWRRALSAGASVAQCMLWHRMRTDLSCSSSTPWPSCKLR